MIEQFFYFFLLFWWFMQIFYKLTQLDKPDNDLIVWACNLKNNFLGWFFDELFNCQLCMESHLGILLAIPICQVYGNWYLLLFGWMAAGLSNIIKRLTK